MYIYIYIYVYACYEVRLQSPPLRRRRLPDLQRRRQRRAQGPSEMGVDTDKLIEIRQKVLCRATRADGVSIDGILPPPLRHVRQQPDEHPCQRDRGQREPDVRVHARQRLLRRQLLLLL